MMVSRTTFQWKPGRRSVRLPFATKEQKEQARKGLEFGKHTSLRTQRDYFRRMADDTDNSDKDRRLWAKLADELDRRIKARPSDHNPNPVQDRLFEEQA
jgi:hypothetical protein